MHNSFTNLLSNLAKLVQKHILNNSSGSFTHYNLYIDVIFTRLVGGSSHKEGRVEVYYNSRWGTVCDDGWGSTDAGVVCRQLGFGSSGTAVYSASFGQGSGSIWLDNVACTGSESTLVSCGHLGVGITRSCSHSEDAGVRCSGITASKFPNIIVQAYVIILIT